MKFVNSYINRELQFAIGQEIKSGRYYLSIPVSNRLVDYEEYYEIQKALHNSCPANMGDLTQLAEKCRAHQHDEWLILKPGSDRGV